MQFTIKDILRILLVLSCVGVTHIKPADADPKKPSLPNSSDLLEKKEAQESIGVEDALPEPGQQPRSRFVRYQGARRRTSSEAVAASAASLPIQSPFGLMGQQPRSNRFQPSFGIASRAALPQPETDITTELANLKDLYSRVRENGVHIDIKLKELIKHIQKQDNQKEEIRKILEGLHKRTEDAGNEKYEKLSKLISETQKIEEIKLPKDFKLGNFYRLKSARLSPISFISALNEMAPILYEYAGKNLELDRLKRAIERELSVQSLPLNLEQKIALSEGYIKAHQLPAEEQLKALRNLHRSILEGKKVQAERPRSVTLSPEPPQITSYSVQYHEHVAMHGNAKWIERKPPKTRKPFAIEEDEKKETSDFDDAASGVS